MKNIILNVKKAKKYEVTRRKQHTKQQKKQKSMKLVQENSILKKARKIVGHIMYYTYRMCPIIIDKI